MLSITGTIPSRGIALVLFSLSWVALPRPAESSPRVVHVFVALADNQHQGIIPVPAVLGNGSDPQRNLYWGAAFGLKTFFRASDEWRLLSSGPGPKPAILDRCVFKSRNEDVFLVGDAYQGSEIKSAVTDFLSAAAGAKSENIHVELNSADVSIAAGGAADLLAYVGHDAFMDFQIPLIAGGKGSKLRRTIILACASKAYFSPYIRQSGAQPLLWTTGLMAPEAYTLKAALNGWIANEDDEAIRHRAAQAYDKYQKCGARAALNLFVTN